MPRLGPHSRTETGKLRTQAGSGRSSVNIDVWTPNAFCAIATCFRYSTGPPRAGSRERITWRIAIFIAGGSMRKVPGILPAFDLAKKRPRSGDTQEPVRCAQLDL